MMYNVHKDGSGNYTVTDISGNMTREERKARDKRAGKQNGVIAFIIVGIIAYFISNSFIAALIAGAIGYIVLRLLTAILSALS